MFSLLFGLWKYLFAKAEYHVLILGIDKAGKTSMSHAFLTMGRSGTECIGSGSGGPINFELQTLLEKVKAIYSDLEALSPERIVPTVGLNIGRVDAHKCKLIFWDLGGQLGLRSIWEKYYEEAHAVLYVVDAACQNRFEDVKNALARVMQHVELDGAPILVLANKQDLPGAISAEDMSRTLDMVDVNDRPCLVKAACAYDGSGVRDGVLWLVEAMKKSQRSEKLKQRAESAIQF